MANDLDGLIDALRRMPGDAGAVGMVSIEQDVFVITRVRGRVVQLMLSDSIAGQDWPIARDAVDYLGLDVPEDEEDSEPVGDLDLFADAGLPEMEMEAICEESDDAVEALEEVAEKIGFGTGLSRIVATLDL
nr:tRNA adenosine deaminase-associated protein [Propioniciclava coleopterorum]